MGHLRRLAANITEHQAFDRLLTEPTDALQWQDIGALQVPWSNYVGRILARLPRLDTLTLLALDRLVPEEEEDEEDPRTVLLSDLVHLTSLTSLQVHPNPSSSRSWRFADRLIKAAEEGALQRLLSIEMDCLDSAVSSDALASVLQGTPVLTSLSLINLSTPPLQFLEHAPHTLRCLSLAVHMRYGVGAPHAPPAFQPSDVSHLRALADRRRSDGQPQLEQLRLLGSIPLDAFARQHFRRQLAVFDYLPVQFVPHQSQLKRLVPESATW
jgi:hypothetical protein